MRRKPRESEPSHHWSKLVSDYSDGELSPDESLSVARHLWECHDCRVLLRDFRAIVAAIRKLRPASRIYDVATRAAPAGICASSEEDGGFGERVHAMHGSRVSSGRRIGRPWYAMTLRTGASKNRWFLQ